MTKSGKRSYPEVGVYEHYKSTPQDRRYYQVLGFARHTETEEMLVIYVPLYTIPEHRGSAAAGTPAGYVRARGEGRRQDSAGSATTTSGMTVQVDLASLKITSVSCPAK